MKRRLSTPDRPLHLSADDGDPALVRWGRGLARRIELVAIAAVLLAAATIVAPALAALL
ncbi:MAG TPA: hypothetical protein VF628_02195 [Allosphingosinicella sp.]